MLKKALIYLGLGPDEEYEQYDDFAPAGGTGGGEEARPAVRSVGAAPAVRPASSSVRPIPATPSPSHSVRAVPATSPSASAPRSGAVAPSSSVDGASAMRIVESPPTKPPAATATSTDL